jgi:hypothetical protein
VQSLDYNLGSDFRGILYFNRAFADIFARDYSAVKREEWEIKNKELNDIALEAFKKEFYERKEMAVLNIYDRINYFEQFIPEESSPSPYIEYSYIEPIQGEKTNIQVLLNDFNNEIIRLQNMPFRYTERDSIKNMEDILYYINTPAESIIPHFYSQVSGGTFNNYDKLSEAAGNYYSTP